MLQFGIASNVDDVIGALTDLEAKHVPFAHVLALNRTMVQGKDKVVEDLPGRFHVRRDWVPKGIRGKFATKSNPVALLFTRDWFMAHQEEGATRSPSKGDAMFIPSLEVREGEAIGGLVKRGMRPGTLLKAAERANNRKRPRYRKGDQAHAKPLAFIATMSTGKRGLFIRREADKRLPIVLLYTLDASVKVPPKWGFQKTTLGVADKHLRREFILALDQALKGAKGGPVKSAYVEHLKEFDGTGQDWYGGGGGGDALSGGVLSGLER